VLEVEKGDVIYVPVVRRAGFGPLHYGVYDGYGGVFHFNGITPEDAYIHYSLLAEFGKGGIVNVDPCIKVFSPNEIVERASSKLGENFGGFNLITNNCEHFAKWCATDVRQSSQAAASQSFVESSSNNISILANKVKQSIAFGKRLLGTKKIQ
jgi:hypothetical protein